MLASVPIVPRKRWVPPEVQVPRPSDEVEGACDSRSYPNAYTAVLGLLCQENQSWQFTRDKRIVEMAKQYLFIYYEHNRNKWDPVFKVQISRNASSLPSIYQWLADMELKPRQLRFVPWIHANHTCETLGFCPYCEKTLNHDNWRKHSTAECFGYGPGEADIVRTFPDQRHFFRWRWLVKGVSDVYVCYGRAYADEDLMMPRLFVYGSEPNQIHKTGRLRTDFQIEQPIKAGTVILVDQHPDDYGHLWGVI
jgi:hypothetical protein